MALINLFSGQQWRNRHREQTYGHRGGEEREGKMCRETNMETYNTICKIDSQLGFCCMSQGTQTGAPYQPRGVGWGGRFKREEDWKCQGLDEQLLPAAMKRI